MNSVQRRLFRAFAQAGGDLSEDAQVEGFIRYVESSLVLLPPRVREAVELVWRGRDTMSYAEIAAHLAQRERAALSVTALQQRVSRGVRLLEDAVRTRSWGSAPAARPGNGDPRR
jgi:DNA-directed RNA polymerase specialized sigma24 family protein